jgi:hypothetical protein
MRGAAVGGLVHLCEQGFTPLLRGGDRCLENRRNADATSTPPSRSSSARSSSVRLFSPAGPGASLAPIAEGGARDGGESDGANSPGARVHLFSRERHFGDIRNSKPLRLDGRLHVEILNIGGLRRDPRGHAFPSDRIECDLSVKNWERAVRGRRGRSIDSRRRDNAAAPWPCRPSRTPILSRIRRRANRHWGCGPPPRRSHHSPSSS